MKYGSKYVQGADITDIAKEIRKDIAHAIAAGELPKTKYSVTIQRYSGGRSLHINATSPVFGPLRSAAQQRYQAYVRKMTDSYNFDGSDLQSDHYHVNFYTHINLRCA